MAHNRSDQTQPAQLHKNENTTLIYYQWGYSPQEIHELISYAKENNIAKLIGKNLSLESYINIRNENQLSLLDLAVLSKSQKILDHIYSLASEYFINEEGQIDFDKTDQYGKNILSWACKTNQINQILSLIEQGVDVNQENRFEERPLVIAAQCGYFEAVKLLINRGAKVNQGNYHGAPLCVATEKNHFEIVKFLIENGAEINQEIHYKGTPLSIAAEKGNFEIAKFLIDNGAKVDQGNTYDGSTPLLIAAKNLHLEVVKLLINKGANVNQANKKGLTPLSGTRGIYLMTKAALSDESARSNLGNDFGPTPLAVYNKCLDITTELISAGAKFTEVDFSPIDLLELQWNKQILELTEKQNLIEGILFLEPAVSTTQFFSNRIINIAMMVALEKARVILEAKKDYKKSFAIRGLQIAIGQNINKSFADHVFESNHFQDIVSSHNAKFSSAAKILSPPLVGLVGFFSESASKILEDKIKTDTELFIERLVNHAQLWSEKQIAQENTASSIRLQNSNI